MIYLPKTFKNYNNQDIYIDDIDDEDNEFTYDPLIIINSKNFIVQIRSFVRIKYLIIINSSVAILFNPCVKIEQIILCNSYLNLIPNMIMVGHRHLPKIKYDNKSNFKGIANDKRLCKKVFYHNDGVFVMC